MAIRYTALPAISLLCAASLHAQPAPPALENLVVTASRTPVQRSRVGSSLTVIERASLEVRQHTLVSDALRDVPGLAISRGGGLGAVTQARIRGSEGNHALVLIDGVEANNPVANSEFDFANLLVSEIERIEILRGPQSALYGSDAVGGVINIITRERAAGRDATVQIEAGSLGTHQIALEIGGGTEHFSGGIAVQDFATDGHNASRTGSERDGFDNNALSLHGRAELNERLTLKGTLRYIDSKQAFDTQDFAFPATPTQGLLIDDDVASNLEQWFLRLEGNLERGRLAHRFGLGETRTDNRFFDGDALTSANRGEKTKLDYQVSIGLAAAPATDGARVLTLALEREQSDYLNRGATPAALENQSQSDAQNSLAAEYLMELGRADVSLSARRDFNDLFTDADTFRITGGYRFGEDTRLHTSLGTGIANPGFFERYGFFPGSFVGNPNLAPEHSTNFDLGLERNFGRVRVDWTYFRADLRDEIQTTFDFSTFLSSVVNLDGDSERRGVEVSLDAQLGTNWSLSAAYTYTDSEQPNGVAEVRRARHIASLDNTVSFANGRGRVHVGIDFNGEQFDSEFIAATPESIVRLPGFTLLKLGGDYRPTEALRVYARVENLLDQAYEEWFSYRGRGRTYVAGFAVDLAR